MLGKHTDCDLSAGLAKIDLVKLTKQVEIHFYSLMNSMRHAASEIQYGNLTPEKRREALASMSSTGADSMIATANNIAEVSELLHTLYETSGRDIEIIR